MGLRACMEVLEKNGPQSWSGGFEEKCFIPTGIQTLEGAATSSVAIQSSR